jgi:hypothetical protein
VTRQLNCLRTQVAELRGICGSPDRAGGSLQASAWVTPDIPDLVHDIRYLKHDVR